MVEEIEFDVCEDAVNAAFLPYLGSKARYRLLWGGRSSSKSDFACLDHLLQCLTLPYFKCLLIRKVADTIQGSLWATLKAVAEREGIDHLFFWGTSPLVIKCLINENTFLARGLDNPRKIKSVREPTHALYEEANETTKEDVEIVGTTLRCSQPGAVIQETFLFNPDQKGDYKQFHLWQTFFEATGHADDATFSGMMETEVDGDMIEQSYEVLHTTIRDNRWASREEIARYKRYGDINPANGKMLDPYLYRIWYEGLWATKQTGNEFYPQFDRGQHTAAVPYLPGLPIWQSWDANSLPYCAMFCAQIDDQRSRGGPRTLRVFQEYAIGSPNSGLRNTGHAFLRDRQRHGWQDSAVMLTGDASLRARKPSDERSTAFDDVQAALNGYDDADGNRVPGCLNSRSAALWPKRNPEVMRRRDFVNYLLAGGFPDIAVLIDAAACPKLVADMELVQLGDDSKLKEMYNDPVLGVRYQKLGHMSDDFDYIVCTVFEPEYTAFKAGRGG